MIREKAAVALLFILPLLLLAPPLIFSVSAETLPPLEEVSTDKLHHEDEAPVGETAEEVYASAAAKTEQVPPPEEGHYTGPCMGEKAFYRTWFDRTHSYLTEMLCQPSVWFDGFFGQHRAGEDWAGSLIRWQNSIRIDELDGSEYRSEFRAQFRLPKMNKKVKLVINSDSSEDQSNIHPDEDPYDLTPGNPGTGKERRTTAGLRFFLTDTRNVRINLGAGLKLGNPVQPYLRFRLRYTESLGSSTLFRLTPSAIWYKEDGINRSLRGDLEHRLSENVLIRASQTLNREELVPGIQWGRSLSLFDRLSQVTVLALEAGATGNTYPEDHVERYRLAMRLRSNFFRKWLFLEAEPEYYWPRDDADNYHLYRAITFRVEMQFYS